MNLAMNTKHSRINCSLFLAVLALSTAILPSLASAQVRTKQPDRDTYNPAGASTPPPVVTTRASAKPVASRGVASSSTDVDNGGRSRLQIENEEIEPVTLKPLPSMVRGKARVLALSGDSASDLNELGGQTETTNQQPSESFIEQTSFEQAPRIHSNSHQLQSPPTRRTVGRQLNPKMRRSSMRSQETLIQHGYDEEQWIDSGEVWSDGYGDPYVGGFDSCDGCGYGGCDGHCGYGACDGGMCNASLCFDPCRWFGSLELLLLFRNGDSIPSLITTSPAGTPADEAGVLPAPTLFGGEQFFKDLTAGGRLTIGTWLDDCRNRSLVFRGWTATESDDSFSARESINGGDILAIPTTNANVLASLLIAFPDSAEDFGRFGSVSASASSNVFGGDVSVRQFWTGGLGTTYDVLYGYQYMRLQEDLQLSFSSTKTQDPFPDEIGNNITSTDLFDTQNEFHGGQLGMAGRYREGCWSFDWLGKVGFGNVRRTSERRGRRVITTDTPPSDIRDTGLLVNEVNRGTLSDSTFGWVPEFDVSIGWHKYPRFDVTFGYNIIAMTDTVRLSGIMDPDNTVDTPQAGRNYDTFVMQGMHFGIRHTW